MEGEKCVTCGGKSTILFLDDVFPEYMDDSELTADDKSRFNHHYLCKDCSLSFGKCVHCSKDTVYTERTFYGNLPCQKEEIMSLLENNNLEYEIEESQHPSTEFLQATVIIKKPYNELGSKNVTEKLFSILNAAEFIDTELYCEFGCDGSFHCMIRGNL